MDYQTGDDFYKVMDIRPEPFIHRPQVVRNASLMLGYTGVYSSFLLHTYRAAGKFNLYPWDILIELGRRKTGGQEVKIFDVAYQLAQRREGA